MRLALKAIQLATNWFYYRSIRALMMKSEEFGASCRWRPTFLWLYELRVWPTILQLLWVFSVLTGNVGVEPGTFRINGRQVIIQAALGEAEVSKLQQAVALRAFKSLRQGCKIARRRRGGRGRGRGRGGALGAGAERAEGSGDGVSESESCDESSDVNESDASAHDSPGEGALSERDETREAPKKAARIANGAGKERRSLGAMDDCRCEAQLWQSGRCGCDLRRALQRIGGWDQEVAMQETSDLRLFWLGQIGVSHKAEALASGWPRR